MRLGTVFLPTDANGVFPRKLQCYVFFLVILFLLYFYFSCFSFFLLGGLFVRDQQGYVYNASLCCFIYGLIHDYDRI